MYVIIGKYGVLMDEDGLVLTHPTGMSFDLTPDEAEGLMRFIKVYQDATATALRDTEPRIERIVIDEGSKASKHETGKRKRPE
jgi:hypothetical protein